jgi:hypothetical protein
MIILCHQLRAVAIALTDENHEKEGFTTVHKISFWLKATGFQLPKEDPRRREGELVHRG